MTRMPGELLGGDEEFALDQRAAAQVAPGGGLLSARLAQPWPIPEFLELACALTQAVAAMHARGILHRDLQPQHVVIEPTPLRVRLCGFGVATRLSREQPSLKPAPELIGSFTYVAPEQTGRLNRSVDFRSDLYALGLILYEALSGQLPFSASHAGRVDPSHVARAPAPLEIAIPTPLATIVEKLLAKAPRTATRARAAWRWIWRPAETRGARWAGSSRSRSARVISRAGSPYPTGCTAGTRTARGWPRPWLAWSPRVARKSC